MVDGGWKYDGQGEFSGNRRKFWSFLAVDAWRGICLGWPPVVRLFTPFRPILYGDNPFYPSYGSCLKKGARNLFAAPFCGHVH